MGDRNRFRKMKTILKELDTELMKYKSVSKSGAKEGLMNLPTGKSEQVKWGNVKQIRWQIAVIKTIAHQRGMKL